MTKLDFRNFVNNGSEHFDAMSYRNDTLTRQRYESKFTEGLFYGVCLSSFEEEENSGNSKTVGESKVSSGFLEITIKPITYQEFSDVKDGSISYVDSPFPIMGDSLPALLGTTGTELVSTLALYNSLQVFKARSDFSVANKLKIEFGQIVECYYENGSIIEGTAENLRFKEPTISMGHPGYRALLGVKPGVSYSSLFSGNSVWLLGNPIKENSNFKPLEKEYTGSNSSYKGKIVKNGLIPNKLSSRAVNGKTNKPIMLTEVVTDYDKMAAAFASEFPGSQLGGTGMRTFERQVYFWEKDSSKAAKPGTSNHGWGLAVDIHFFVGNSKKKLIFGQDEYEWLYANASRFDFENPQWATNPKQGKKAEPWHWESTRRSQIIKGI
jgi:hypothetical protein